MKKTKLYRLTNAQVDVILSCKKTKGFENVFKNPVNYVTESDAIKTSPRQRTKGVFSEIMESIIIKCKRL